MNKSPVQSLPKVFFVFLTSLLLFACASPAQPKATTIPIPGIPTFTRFTAQTPAPPLSHSSELTVVGQLTYIATPLSGCGFIHFGAVAEYSDLKILEGKSSEDTIYVIHGCPELKRSEYAKDSGTLESFQTGDYHLLHLTLQNIYHVEAIVFGERLERLNDVCLNLPAGCTAEELVERQNGRMYFASQVDLYSP